MLEKVGSRFGKLFNLHDSWVRTLLERSQHYSAVKCWAGGASWKVSSEDSCAGLGTAVRILLFCSFVFSQHTLHCFALDSVYLKTAPSLNACQIQFFLGEGMGG